MNIDEQKSKAMAFRAMHRSAKVLVLPNAWDVASARVFEEAGFGAVATTSAGVAFGFCSRYLSIVGYGHPLKGIPNCEPMPIGAES